MSRGSLQTWARALGGEVSGNSVSAPGPGHSARDRSLSLTPSAVWRPTVSLSTASRATIHWFAWTPSAQNLACRPLAQSGHEGLFPSNCNREWPFVRAAIRILGVL
jgi:hypothetical protein